MAILAGGPRLHVYRIRRKSVERVWANDDAVGRLAAPMLIGRHVYCSTSSELLATSTMANTAGILI